MCRMARYGNCDPETKDQEYCIFHKPNKNPEEALEFYKKFLERFRPTVEESVFVDKMVRYFIFDDTVNCRGYVFPPLPKKPVKYEDPQGNQWNEGFTFEYAVFRSKVYFQGAVFEGSTSFRQAEFREDADFSNAKFLGSVSFQGAEFEKWAVFRRTEFKGLAEFRGAEFRGPALFIAAGFYKYAGFGGAMFRGTAFFIGASFSGREVYFGNAEFLEKANFRNAMFQCDADFHGAFFNDASFEGARFLSKARFEDTCFVTGIFYRAKFLGETLFREMRFNIHYRPRCRIGLFMFGEQEIRESKGDSYESRFASLEALAQAARIQRLTYEYLGERELADEMFKIEMRAIRRHRTLRAKNLVEKETRLHRRVLAWIRYAGTLVRNFLEWLVVDVTIKYGMDEVRVLAASAATIILFGLIYAALAGQIPEPLQGPEPFARLINSIYISLVAFVTFGQVEAPFTDFLLKTLYTLETVLGAALISLLGTLIQRRRIRR